MKGLVWFVGVVNVLGLAYGVYNELAPIDWPFAALPDGMGLALSLISGTMGLVVMMVEQERQARLEAAQAESAWDRVAGVMTAALPAHERDFYSLWPAQVRSARNNVDVTHLGPRPPAPPADEEQTYFDSLDDLVKSCKAPIRRVERYTPAKLQYLREMAARFSGVRHFSLRAIIDPSTEDMPFSLSISRVDDRFGWIVAMAEHESTMSYRDLMLTGKESVDLLSRYFQNRLWQRSVKILENGAIVDGWDTELTR